MHACCCCMQCLTHVLSRRRKTLLWLDDHPERPENVRIRLGIPGHSRSQELTLDRDQCSIAADNEDIALEDQVDVTLFTSLDAIEAFLRHPSQHKFTKYPPSLFRIVTNRRLFVGPRGLCARMSSDPKWQSTFPAIMVFHGDCDDGLDAHKGRPNLNITRDADHCTAFVSFQSAEVAALKAMDAAASAPARVRELRAKWRLCATAPMPMLLLMFFIFRLFCVKALSFVQHCWLLVRVRVLRTSTSVLFVAFHCNKIIFSCA